MNWMTSIPWLELAILTPLLGAVLLAGVREREYSRHWALVFTGFSLIFAIQAWVAFDTRDHLTEFPVWDLTNRLFGRDSQNHASFAIDNMSAPLLCGTALIHFLTALITLRTKMRRFSFSMSLFSEALNLAIFSCQAPWLIITLVCLTTVPPYLELRARKKPTRVFVSHMVLFMVLLVLGWSLAEAELRETVHSNWAIVPLLAAIFIRAGIIPLHCWMTDLFEHATFGTALLYVLPMPAAYIAVRLVLPIGTEWMLWCIGLVALITAVYAAGMSLVQKEARRYFCYLFLSHSALIFVGLDSLSSVALTGSLCVWISVLLALGGFGLTLRSLEARRGRVSLAAFQGGYEHTPSLAVCFLLTGLASVGFPGTIGFLGTEMLVDGAVQSYVYVGVAVAIAGALNGIAVVKAYFRLFTGGRHTANVPLGMGWRERFSVLGLAALILGGGLMPNLSVLPRYEAAKEILEHRRRTFRISGPDESFRAKAEDLTIDAVKAPH